MDDTNNFPSSNQLAGGNRGHGAPSAASAASTHPYAAGLNGGMIVVAAAPGGPFAYDHSEHHVLLNDSWHNTTYEQAARFAFHGDRAAGHDATADGHGDPRRGAAGGSHGYTRDDVMVDSTDNYPPNFIPPNWSIPYATAGNAMGNGFWADYDHDTTGYETDTTGDGFVLVGGYEHDTVGDAGYEDDITGDGFVLLGEPRRGDTIDGSHDTTGDDFVLLGERGEADVGDLEAAFVVGEEVLGLEVAVRDAAAVEEADGGHELLEVSAAAGDLGEELPAAAVEEADGGHELLEVSAAAGDLGEELPAAAVPEADGGHELLEVAAAAGDLGEVLPAAGVLQGAGAAGEHLADAHHVGVPHHAHDGDLPAELLHHPLRAPQPRLVDHLDRHAHDATRNCAASCTVQSVWRDNCTEVFEVVVAMLRLPHHHLYIALDLEFVADASTNVYFRPFTWDQWYHHLHAFVNGGDVIQVGLAFAFDLEHQHGGPHHQAPTPVIALEVNLEFDEDARQYNDVSLSFVAKQGHCLAEHKNRGVPVKEFLDGLLRHLVSDGHNDPITWITFHGDNDLGFLIRLLQERHGCQRGALPSDRAAFMRQVRQQFPNFYDLRVLGQLVKQGFRGKFSVLADLLGVERVGDEHHAGSDAVLTMACFSKVLRRSQHKLHRLESRKCLLSGMEDLNMAIKCARKIGEDSFTTIEVRGHNFDEEAWRIVDLVTSNFKIVGVHVLLPPLGSGSALCSAPAEQEDYDLMKNSLDGISEFQVEIGFMNAEGMLAFGRVWRIYLRRTKAKIVLAGENDCVDPRRLAWLLASCGATHNPAVVWATYQGSEGIACLIKSSLPAGDLPGNWSSYNDHRRARFPGMYDVGLIAQRWPDTGLLPTGCRGTLLDIARNLKVIKGDERHPMENVLLVLRCYKRLEECPHFPLIASGVLGQLMASQRCGR